MISLADAIENNDIKSAGGLTFNQTRLYILSKAFAAGKPAETLKVLGRIPNSPLNASVAVFDGEVSALLAKKRIEEKTTANFLVVLLKQAQHNKYASKVTLFRFILGGQDPFVDFALPLIKMKGDRVQLNGSALFSEGSYSGIDLSMTQTKIASLMKEGKGTGTNIVTEVDNSTYQLWVKKVNRDIIVNSIAGNINEIVLPMKMQIILTDTGKNNKALSQSKLESIEKLLTIDVNKQALETIKFLQKANCDYLGLARKIHGYHYKEWCRMNWREAYPNLTIRREIKLQILNSGVML